MGRALKLNKLVFRDQEILRVGHEAKAVAHHHCSVRSIQTVGLGVGNPDPGRSRIFGPGFENPDATGAIFKSTEKFVIPVCESRVDPDGLLASQVEFAKVDDSC